MAELGEVGRCHRFVCGFAAPGLGQCLQRWECVVVGGRWVCGWVVCGYASRPAWCLLSSR